MSSQLKFSNFKIRHYWNCSLSVTEQRLTGVFLEKMQISGGSGGRKFFEKWPENGVFRGFLKNVILWQRRRLSRPEQFRTPNTMASAVFTDSHALPLKSAFESRECTRRVQVPHTERWSLCKRGSAVSVVDWPASGCRFEPCVSEGCEGSVLRRLPVISPLAKIFCRSMWDWLARGWL